MPTDKTTRVALWFIVVAASLGALASLLLTHYRLAGDSLVIAGLAGTNLSYIQQLRKMEARR
jgi:hypothetical protein